MRYCYSYMGIHNDESTLGFYSIVTGAALELLFAQILYLLFKRHMSLESVARRVRYSIAALIFLNIVIVGCFWLYMTSLSFMYV